MRYELFLRRDAALSAAEIDQATTAAAAGGVSLELYRDERADAVGFDVGAATEEPAGAQALCAIAFGLARELQLAVYDPQLSRSVSSGDGEAIAERFGDTASFASGVPLTAPGAGATPATRLWIIIAVGLVGVLLLSRLLRCALL